MPAARSPVLLLLLAVASVAMAGRVYGQTLSSFEQGTPTDAKPAEYDGVTVDEKLGQSLSLDTQFVNEAGQTVALRDYLGKGRPLVVSFVYHNCPMLCSLVLDGMAKAVSQTALTPGQDYDLLSISFNPSESHELAAAAKAKYVAAVNQPEAAQAGWHFLTGDQPNIARLTDELGFRFRWDERRQEYAHNAVLMFVSPEGVITRYLYGIEYPADDFRKAIVEASDGTVGTTLDRFLLYCFMFDTQANAYVMHAMRVMQLGGGLTVLIMGGLLFYWFRRERRQRSLPALPDGIAPAS